MTLRIRSPAGVYNQTPQTYSNTTYGLMVENPSPKWLNWSGTPNWENPILSNILGLGTATYQWPGGIGTPQGNTLFRKPPPVPGNFGSAIYGDTSSAYKLPQLICPTTNIGTVLGLFSTVTDGIVGIFAGLSGNIVGHQMRVSTGTAGSASYWVGNNTGTGTGAGSGTQYTRFSTEVYPFINGKLHCIAMCARSYTEGSAYVDGKKLAVSQIGTSTTYVRDVDSYIGKFNNYGNTVYIYAYAVWDRALTEVELASVTLNPWQLFSRSKIPLTKAPRIYYVAGPSSSWSTPTPVEIVAGQLAGGATPTAAWSESAPTYTTQPFSFSQPASGLTLGTKYRAAAVYESATSNILSNVIESPIFLAGGASLSNATVTNIGFTTVTPQVTVGY